MRIIQENAKDMWRNRVCALFIPGVMLGMAFSWCYGKKYVAYAGILSAYYLQRYHYAAPSREQLFFFLLRERGMGALVLCALSATVVRALAVRLFSCWAGFCAGTYFTMLGLKFGAEGLAFGVLGLLPQYIFYVAAYFLLATGAGTTGTGIGGTRDAAYRRGLPGNAGAGSWFSRVLCTDRTWGRGMASGSQALALVRIFLLFFMGLALEAWVNPLLVRMLVKIL